MSGPTWSHPRGGGYLALRTADAHPRRVGRMVQMGCSGAVRGMRLPLFIRLIMPPGFRHLMGALPPSEGAGRMSLRQIGHGASLHRGRIPQAFFDGYLALQQHTDTMRHEMEMLSAAGTFWKGFHAALELDEQFFRSVTIPTCLYRGSEDPLGDTHFARHLAESFQNGTLEIAFGAGHLPWLDEPEHAADTTRRFLRAGGPSVAEPG